MTKTQLITLLAFVAFTAYEVYLATLPDPGNIRVDLVIFPPILLILTGVSLYQYFRKK